MSEQARRILKDVAILGVLLAALSSAYYMFVIAERYRALTQAYIQQSQQILVILQQQAERENQPEQARAEN